MILLVAANADAKSTPTRPRRLRTDAVSLITGSAPRRRDEHNPPPCVGGQFEPGTDASVVGTLWPPAGREHARAPPPPGPMRCGSTASGDRNHRRQGPTRQSGCPDRD